MKKILSKFTKDRKKHFYRMIKEYENATALEIWEGIRDNFLFGFIAATIIVFVSSKNDYAVFGAYITYYYMLGRIQNRPRYVTSLGKLIVFPIPSAVGAFAGYKLSYVFQTLIGHI